MGIGLTCDFSVLHSHHRDDCLNILQGEDYGWDKEGAANSFQCHSENEWKWKKGKRETEAGMKGGGGYFIVIQEALGEEHYDSARPLDMAALPVLNQSQRLQLMVKIRNNHRLPLIILN